MRKTDTNIYFFKSAENNSNILVKSLNAELHEKHSKNMISQSSNDFLDFKKYLKLMEGWQQLDFIVKYLNQECFSD